MTGTSESKPTKRYLLGQKLNEGDWIVDVQGLENSILLKIKIQEHEKVLRITFFFSGKNWVPLFLCTCYFLRS